MWTADEAGALLREWLPSVDLVIASDDELPRCLPGPPGGTAEGAARLLDLGVREVVVTHGAAGATAFTDSGSRHRPATPVRAVDPVGTGDAFVAGYLSALLDGADLAGRLARAATTGAFAVASAGDWEGAPTRGTGPAGRATRHRRAVSGTAANLGPCLVTNTGAAPVAPPSS
ncbi:PfkB family carbohydrate kinase [Streptomyces sp. CT34]|uniref:carbohydrate kinase family protein n=1 Tax=Streptomyces sp. CT34 TaxID=1553907 RepID=UPI00321F6436